MISRFVPRHSSVSAPSWRRLSTAWTIVIVLFGCLCLVAGMFFASITGERVLSTLRFAWGGYNIPQKQQQLQYALNDVLQQSGLDEQAYQHDYLQPQQRGRER